MSTLGERLYRARKRAGLSLRKLAARVGTSHGYIRDLEKGLAEPSLDMFRRLVEALNVSADWLLGRTDEELPARPLRERLPDEWRELVRQEVREELRRLRRGDD